MRRVIIVLLILLLSSGGADADQTLYVVQRGDTLYRIAAQYGSTVNAISAANGIANPNRIYVGQRLVIPGAAVPVVPATAPAPAADVYVVQRGDTLFGIAARFGVSLQDLVTANGVANPNLIYAGQALVIRGAAVPPASPVDSAPSPASPANSKGATFTVSDLYYSADGRQAHMLITVTNHSLQPAVASGNWYPILNPDGGRQWVTLLKADHRETPVPMTWDPTHGQAPLWEIRVTTDDGLVFPAYPGCEYYDTIVGQGFEPTAQGGFNWTQVLEGGWFRCGRDYSGAPKPDYDLLPGQSAQVPLSVWLVHPNLPADQAPRRRIVRLDFIPYAPDGTSFGVQDSLVLP
ncbi:MAG: LysM peptidoglycan-binding domain-containing protein [Anaerolineae bacterium]|nr:LysM peptidoglycan-binding domain-containing protein [Anaerolineae bacterium]